MNTPPSFLNSPTTHTQPQPQYPKVGDTVLGSFQLLRQINAGSFAVAYLAKQQNTDRKAVVKVVHPHLYNSPQREHIASRFSNEFQAASRVQHKGIATVFVHGLTPQGLPAIAMEYVPGKTLGEFLTKYAPLKHNQTLNLFFQLASVLDAIHSAGIIHRDISPSNIMVQREPSSNRPRYILLDFGIARLDGQHNMTQGPVGTPCYIAPELFRNETTPACDIYSLGALLVWAISGQPFQPPTNQGIQSIENTLRANPRTAPISTELLRFICQTLHPSPLLRPTANDILRLLPSMARSKTIPSSLIPNTFSTLPPQSDAPPPPPNVARGPVLHPKEVSESLNQTLLSILDPPISTPHHRSNQQHTPQPAPQPPPNPHESILLVLSTVSATRRSEIIDLFIGYAPEWLADLDNAMQRRDIPASLAAAQHLGAQAKNIHAHQLTRLTAMFAGFVQNAMWIEADNILHEINEEYGAVFRTLLSALSS